MNLSKLHLAVLKGGVSREREISLLTGTAVAKALRGLGHRVEEIDVRSENFDLPQGLDFVFTCLHGTFGEDGGVQSFLISKGVRFNGSGAESCRKSLDKMETKKILCAAGVPMAKSALWRPEMNWPLPYVLKPVAQGSSIGVFRVTKEEEVEPSRRAALELSWPMMIESMIVGREFSVGILGDEALPPVEIRPKVGFYDYKNKYTAGMTEHLCPAPVSPALDRRIREIGLAAHRALGCEVYSRVDVMADEKEQCFALELNSIPGMTEFSIFPEEAKAAGLDFPQLCQKIIELSWDVKR
ncbi:MAG: D-alanine--D-alanine ligase [bacterium]